ncbi:YfiR family protein [Methylomonas sp. MgM2]
MAILRATIPLILAAIFARLAIKNAEAVENSELIRASIIEKVASFIEWPSLNQAHFTICSFDDTPLLSALQIYYENSFFNNKPIKLVTFHNYAALSDCQIIYLSADESSKLDDIIKQTEKRPILIITEKKDAVSHGAHIGFFAEENRLHLEINRTALSASHLSASYHLLGVARIVE